MVNVGVHNAYGYAVAGYETHLVVGMGPPSETDDDFRSYYGLDPHPNLQIHRIARKSLFGSNSTLPIFWHAYRLIRRLAEGSPVAAIAREPSFLPYLALLSRSPQIRTCFEAHNFYADLSWRTDRIRIQDRHQSWLERMCIPRLAGLAGIVAPLTDLYGERFPGVPCATFPLGAQPLQPGDIEARRLARRAVYVGHLHTAKGVKTLIEAVSPATGDLRASFWGGTDEQVAKYGARIKAKGLGDRLEFSAFRPPDELQRALATEASVGVVALHDSFYNANLTCPAKALDYLSHGLPVVASDLPSIRSLLGPAAIYVPPADGVALRAALLGLLGDPVAYREQSALSWSRAEELAWPKRACRVIDWLSDSQKTPQESESILPKTKRSASWKKWGIKMLHLFWCASHWLLSENGDWWGVELV